MRRNRAIFAERKPRRTGWAASLLLFFLIAAVVIALNFINNGRIAVAQESVTITSLSKDLEGFRILHISDLHGNEYGANQNTIATMIKTQRYSAVCVTGDVCGPDGDYDAFLKLINLFSVPVYFVTGDEDPEPILTAANPENQVKADFIRAAEEHGAIYLDHPEKLTVGKSVIWFAPESMYGLDLPSSYAAYYNRRETLQAAGTLTADQEAQLRSINYRIKVLDDISAAMKEMQPGDVQIALTHHPLTEETIKTLQQWAGSDRNDFFRGVSLVLAGHYTAGQMRLPLLGAIRAPESLGGWFPKDSDIVGLSTVQGVTQYISPGLGASAIYPIKFRLFNTPTVTVLTLTGVLSF